MVFDFKLYNSLPIDVKNITNIKYFRKLEKKMLLQTFPYNLDQCPPIRNGVTSGQAFSLRSVLTGEARHRPLRGLGKVK